MKEELFNFFQDYHSSEFMEAPIIYKPEERNHCDDYVIQFNGWSITLYPDGTYMLMDTSGG